MDPDATLARLRAAVEALSHGRDPDPEVEEAIDAWLGLDRWLTKGGFLPADWQGSLPPQHTEAIAEQQPAVRPDERARP